MNAITPKKSNYHSYSNVISLVNKKIETISFEPTNDELKTLEQHLIHWNRVVTIITTWYNAAERILRTPNQRKMLRKELKQKLIKECDIAIENINNQKLSHHKAKSRRQFLIKELRDRKTYIKKFF